MTITVTLESKEKLLARFTIKPMEEDEDAFSSVEEFAQYVTQILYREFTL